VRAAAAVAGDGAGGGGEGGAKPARLPSRPGCKRRRHSAGARTACVVGREDGVLKARRMGPAELLVATRRTAKLSAGRTKERGSAGGRQPMDSDINS
jgi:hypothetical protein